MNVLGHVCQCVINTVHRQAMIFKPWNMCLYSRMHTMFIYVMSSYFMVLFYTVNFLKKSATAQVFTIKYNKLVIAYFCKTRLPAIRRYYAYTNWHCSIYSLKGVTWQRFYFCWCYYVWVLQKRMLYLLGIVVAWKVRKATLSRRVKKWNTSFLCRKTLERIQIAICIMNPKVNQWLEKLQQKHKTHILTLW